MKAGEVSLNNTLLDGASIYGVSFSPDSALSPDDAGVQVSGIANTSQARVEIRQGNKLIASNLVPQGPFTLTDLKLLDRSSDLSVTVVESDGSQQRFIVPATQYNRGVGTPTGIHVAFGRVDDDYKKTPWVGSVSMGKRLTNNINLSGGLIGGQDYQNAAINVDWLLSRLSATTQIAASNDREYNLQGQKASVSANYALTQNVSLRASASHATRDYRTLSDSLDSDFVAQNKNEYSAGVSLATGMTGSLGLSYYQADSYQNSNDSRYLALSWSKVFRRATLSVSWQHQLGTNGRMRYADGNGKDSNTANDKDLVYVNLSVPLGSNSANLYSRHDSNSTHFGAAMNANVSDELNYSVGAERGTKDNVNAAQYPPDIRDGETFAVAGKQTEWFNGRPDHTRVIQRLVEGWGPSFYLHAVISPNRLVTVDVKSRILITHAAAYFHRLNGCVFQLQERGQIRVINFRNIGTSGGPQILLRIIKQILPRRGQCGPRSCCCNLSSSTTSSRRRRVV
jgi:outer membrane usher protein FimD/PapC